MKSLDKMTDEEYEYHVVAKFRETHHQIALMIASGWTQAKVSRVTGRSMRSLHLLTKNPAFEELVAQYKKKKEGMEEQWMREQLEEQYNQQRRDMRRAAIIDEMINERLEKDLEEGKYPSYRDMNMLLSESLGRLGWGKTSTIRHEVGFSSELEKAIARSGKPQSKLIEASAIPLAHVIEGPPSFIDRAPSAKVEFRLRRL